MVDVGLSVSQRMEELDWEEGPLHESYGSVAARLVAAIEREELNAQVGYLVGLDRPTLLSPDPAAVMVGRRRDEVMAQGHRWRVVTESLWNDVLGLGRERPEQRVYVLPLWLVDVWLGDELTLQDLDRDGWRGNQGTTYIMPILGDRE